MGFRDSNQRPAPFCVLPWNHLQISPNGKVHSCCQTTFKKSLGNLNNASLKEIWKGKEFNQLRDQMLGEELVEECKRCYEIEKLNVPSMRNESNEQWDLPEALPDQPYYLDLRFDNICNFKCRTCTPHYSSSWEGEYKKIHPNKSIEVEKNGKLEETWSDIKDWLPEMQRIYFAGGEPLLSDYHLKVLRELVDIGNTDLSLDYNTNFSILPDEVLLLWKNFSKINIWSSLDGVEEVGEFIRKGMKWSDILANREKLKEYCPLVSFKVELTLSVYNVFHLPRALKYFRDENFLESYKDFRLNFLHEPTYLSAGILLDAEILKLEELYENSKNEFKKTLPEDEWDLVSSTYKNVLDFVKLNRTQKERIVFKIFNNKLDNIRRDHSKRIFPELGGLI